MCILYILSYFVISAKFIIKIVLLKQILYLNAVNRYNYRFKGLNSIQGDMVLYVQVRCTGKILSLSFFMIFEHANNVNQKKYLYNYSFTFSSKVLFYP